MDLHRLSEGPGPSILLLHALPLDHRMWLGVADHLPGNVIAIDIPGRLDLAIEPSFDILADLVAERLVQSVGRVVVVGCSMGGYLGLALAARHPGLVTGLCLVDTRAEADQPESQTKRLAMVAEIERTGSVAPAQAMVPTLFGVTTVANRVEVVDAANRWAGEQTVSAISWCQRAIAARPDRTSDLAEFEGPVVVIAGAEDTLTGGEVAVRLSEIPKNGNLVVIPNAGHLSPVEEPEQVGTAISSVDWD